MKISAMASLQRPITCVLFPAFLLFALELPVVAQEQGRSEGRIENAKWGLAGNVVVITYDLVANSELTFDIGIVLRRESDSNFKLIPRTLSGAIGKGKHAGAGREIRWDYLKDVPGGLQGDDYHFEFAVQIIREEAGSNLWYYLVAGAVVVGGGAAALLGGGKNGSTTTPSTSGLPDAPKIRPLSQ